MEPPAVRLNRSVDFFDDGGYDDRTGGSLVADGEGNNDVARHAEWAN
jgi:hypothetical protein